MPLDNPHIHKLTAVLAERELARRKLINFVLLQYEGYEAGWVQRDICTRLELFYQAVQDRKSPRLMLNCPPRLGKSLLASTLFPAWALGKDPKMTIISTSYNLDLPLMFSRKVRGYVRDDETYHSIFPDTRLSTDSQSAETWETTEGGVFVAVGIGGGLTGKGAHCVIPSTKIRTRDGFTTLLELIKNRHEDPMVLTYDGTNIIERPVNAIATRTAKGLYTVKTATSTTEITGEHPVCVGFDAAGPRYRRVDELRTGDYIISVNFPETLQDGEAIRPMPDVSDNIHTSPSEVPSIWRTARAYMLEQVQRCLKEAGQHCNSAMSSVRHGIHRNTVVTSPETSQGTGIVLLLSEMLRRASSRYLCWGSAPQIHTSRTGMYAVQHAVPQNCECRQSDTHQERILLSGMLPRVHNGEGKSPESVASGAELSAGVQAAPQTDVRDEPFVCRVWRTSRTATPQGRGQREQRDQQLSSGLPSLPPTPSQWQATHRAERITAITYVHGDVLVGDIEVEESHSFLLFNNHLLHNCLIVDDNIKNSEEADNQAVHNKQYEWYQSTAYTRLAPGGGVIIIATRWNYSDLSGRLQNMHLTDPDADRFEVISYPAIAETYEYRHYDDHSMYYLDQPSSDPNLELLREPGQVLHPERFNEKMVGSIKANLSARIWSALYQQKPTPDEGIFIRKEYFRYLEDIPYLATANMYTAWDFAISMKTASDYTASSTVVQDSSGMIIVEDITRFKRDTYGIVEAIIDEAKRCMETYPSYNYMVGMEDGQIFKTLQPVLNRRMKERKVFFTYEALTPLTDKMVRARPLQSLMQQGLVYFLSGLPALPDAVSELLQFPASTHDDMVDSLSWCVRLSLKHEPPIDAENITQARTKSWRDDLSMSGYSPLKNHFMGD